MYNNTPSTFIDTRKPGETIQNPKVGGDAKPKVEYVRENILFANLRALTGSQALTEESSSTV